MIQKVKQYIEDNQLLHREDKIIVGVSGGADSVALLDILIDLGYSCIVAHCNFHLRGEESNRDAKFVSDLCIRYKLPLNSIDFDTVTYATENGISIEMAARELRYNWFEKLRFEHKASCIAVAHHQDDSVETIILNLTRGTGIRGLTGINVKNGYIVRPLLCLTRNEILLHLNQKHLSYVVDSTNEEDIYTRNKIRLNIIPLLESINPSVKEAIIRTAGHLRQVENIYNDYIASAQKEIMTSNTIDIELLLKYKEPEAILFEILSPYGFNASSVYDAYSAINTQSGKTFYSATHKLVKDRRHFILQKLDEVAHESYQIDENSKHIDEPLKLDIDTIRIEDFDLQKNTNILYLDAAKIKYPLTIRKWEKGDWFIPFGMKGRKKLSDYFSDNKFSLIDKEQTWLLCSGDNIVWIIGHRSDNRFKVDTTTQTILKITLQS